MKIFIRIIVVLALTAGAIELIWFRQLREISNSSNRPVDFYGVCVDQDGNPVSDVNIVLAIRWSEKKWPFGIHDVFKYPTMTTGKDGCFTLTGETGALLGIKSVSKAGYETSQKSLNRSFWYWSDPRQVYHPDPSHPVVFHLWKNAGAETLVDKGIGTQIPYDGTPTQFDLLEGKAVSSGGDLRVCLSRTPVQIQYGQRNYEWTASIEVIGGGLSESTEEQMYRAPAKGYRPKLVVHMSANDPDWTDEKDLTFYLLLRNGKLFGRAEVKFLVGSDRASGTPFYVTSFINPSGSQNLEYDSRQHVRR